ncbi:MAG: ROK family transcriptional regulator [Lentisphaerae bacterium]|nr:ROK family transcriptional regulator [Lentisphaerota bacterium]
MARQRRAEAEVLAEMVRFPARSRGDLCRRLGRSKASVSRLVDRLLRAGYVEEGAKQAEPGRRGRRTTLLRVRPDVGYLVGADLEGLAARACVLDGTRRIVAAGRRTIRDSWSMARTVGVWTELIEDVIRRSRVPRGKLAGLGVGVPGVLLADGLRIRSHLPPGRRVEFDLEPQLSRFGLPLAAANNVLCVAEYERRVGWAAGAPSFLSVLVRYGIGAAIYSRGHFLLGDGVFTGELGHMRIDARGPVCVCGQRGCLDAYCSGRTWPAPEARSGAAWRRGLRQRGRYLGIAVANLLKLCHLPRVVINGIYNEYAGMIRPVVLQEIETELKALGLDVPEVGFGEPVECKAGIGAALRAADAHFADYVTTRVFRERVGKAA